MKLIDESVPLTADPEVWIHGGRIEYKLNFKCNHDRVQVMNGEVTCFDCHGQEVTEDDAVKILRGLYES